MWLSTRSEERTGHGNAPCEQLLASRGRAPKTAACSRCPAALPPPLAFSSSRRSSCGPRVRRVGRRGASVDRSMSRQPREERFDAPRSPGEVATEEAQRAQTARYNAMYDINKTRTLHRIPENTLRSVLVLWREILACPVWPLQAVPLLAPPARPVDLALTASILRVIRETTGSSM